jgi:hypothetical protein
MSRAPMTYWQRNGPGLIILAAFGVALVATAVWSVWPRSLTPAQELHNRLDKLGPAYDTTPRPIDPGWRQQVNTQVAQMKRERAQCILRGGDADACTELVLQAHGGR